MLKNNLSLEKLITGPQTLESDVIRFLLSDFMTVPLECVLTGRGHPTGYADKMLSVHRYDLYYTFFEPLVKEYKVPNYLVDGWIFDVVTSAAMMLRATAVRPHDLDHVYDLSTKANAFLLCLEDNKIVESHLSGLATFPSIACDFISANADDFLYHDRRELFRLIANVAEIDGPGWLFHNRTWRTLFMNNANRLKLLRTFLHMSLVHYILPDEVVESHFGVDRNTILTLMYDFSDIRESTRQSKQAILEFIQRLQINCDMVGENQFFKCMFEGPFGFFSKIHDATFPQPIPTLPKPPSVRVTFKHNQP